jgi:hypothetical protein
MLLRIEYTYLRRHVALSGASSNGPNTNGKKRTHLDSRVKNLPLHTATSSRYITIVTVDMYTVRTQAKKAD